jgi:hypothetical protein
MKKTKSIGKETNQPTGATEYRLNIFLFDVEPLIWREVVINSDISLAKLHRVIQIAMGWFDGHLHQFETTDGTCYGSRDSAFDPPPDLRSEASVRVADVLRNIGDELLYTYDFGDGWEHGIELLAIAVGESQRRKATCVAGARACPPEDCGGPGGYEQVLAAIRNPKDKEYEETLEWIGEGFDPEAFDIDLVNKELASLGR